MQTKELIAELLRADPTGDGEVCVANKDIHFIKRDPAYYDGCLERLIKNLDGDVISGRITAVGAKIDIVVKSIEDCILDNPDFPVDCSESYTKIVDGWRENSIRINKEIEFFEALAALEEKQRE